MSSSKGNQDGKDQGAGDSPQPAVQFRSCTDCYPDNYQEPIGLLNSIQSCGKVDCLKKIWFSEAYRERRESNEGINFCFREYYTPLTLAVTAGNYSAVFWLFPIQVLITIFELRPDSEALWKALSFEPIRSGLEQSQHQKMTKIKGVLTKCHLGALNM